MNEDELDRWTAAAGRLWLFLDYDGTLADFPPTPMQVEPQAEIIELIKQLSASPRFRVTVISGRRLKDVQTLLPAPGVFLAGIYGVELQTPEGELIHQADYAAIRSYLEKLKPRWKKIVAGHPGLFLEDKGWTLALHARSVGQTTAASAFSAARQAAGDEAPPDRFRWFEDSKFLEIAPAQAHKGRTVRYLLKHFPFPSAQPLYLGDDDKDQEAFETVHALGGIVIQVLQGEDSSPLAGADYTLDSPSATRRWLKRLLSHR
jgi:trehalose 6-phosphate phosphatase